MYESVYSEKFRRYGRVLEEYDLGDILARLETTPIPEDVQYVMASPQLEASPFYQDMRDRMYGESAVQIGYCNGHNKKLNALEYHRSSEVNVAGTDMVLLLGLLTDVTPDHTYDTSAVQAFLVPKGTAVEIYATTLHYAPCSIENTGFRCAVVLPKGTNGALKKRHTTGGEDRLLAAANKWLIAHEEAGIEGAFNGLQGENTTI